MSELRANLNKFLLIQSNRIEAQRPVQAKNERYAIAYSSLPDNLHIENMYLPYWCFLKIIIFDNLDKSIGSCSVGSWKTSILKLNHSSKDPVIYVGVKFIAKTPKIYCCENNCEIKDIAG